mmetsp:Transcript_54167/g.131446  ORF Transcript_54167/g.131446 Transcript_54167/m.131446 type:complete len:625 (+) Transcript_54167:171-2045(+)
MDIAGTELSKLCKALVDESKTSSKTLMVASPPSPLSFLPPSPSSVSTSVSVLPSSQTIQSNTQNMSCCTSSPHLHHQSSPNGTALHRLLAARTNYTTCCPRSLLVEKLLEDKHVKQQYQHHELLHSHHQQAHCCGKSKSSWSISNSIIQHTTTGPIATGATALHVAVFRNSSYVYDIVKLLLQYEKYDNEKDNSEDTTTDDLDDDHHNNNNNNNRNPTSTSSKRSVASIPLERCGSYPLHVVCGQNLTIDERVVELLLHSDRSVALEEDKHGDTPLSLLWKNTCRFRWTLSIMDTTKPYIDYIEENQSSWMTIISPFQFIRLSKLLIYWSLSTNVEKTNASDTGCGGGKKSDEDVLFDGINTDSYVTIHDLCSINRLPPMIYQMTKAKPYNDVLKVVGNARTFDDEGRLPLHVAVQVRPSTYHFVPDFVPESARKSLIQHLLEEYPEAVYVLDNTGRLPIHYALHSGVCIEDDLLSLLRLYPDSLRIQDPVTHLLPFMLVAANHQQHQYQQHHCLPNVSKQLISICTASTGEHAIPQTMPNGSGVLDDDELDAASTPSSAQRVSSQVTPAGITSSSNKRTEEEQDHHWKDDHIRMTFHLLQLCPDVVHLSSSLSGILPSPSSNR